MTMEWEKHPTDYNLLEAELRQEAIEAAAEYYTCDKCDDFFEDGPFQKWNGMCRRYSGIFEDQLDPYFVKAGDYHPECFND